MCCSFRDDNGVQRNISRRNRILIECTYANLDRFKSDSHPYWSTDSKRCNQGIGRSCLVHISLLIAQKIAKVAAAEFREL